MRVPDYELPTAPPPNPGTRGMARAAEAMGESGIDQVDTGGQPDLTMSRPEPDRGSGGPVAAVLRDRLSGSSAAVNAAAASVGQREDGPADARRASKG